MKYDPEAFAALTDYAHSIIPPLNEEYERVGQFGVAESAVNAQNRVAAKQAEHLHLLGELSDELGGEQLAIDLLRTEREFDKTQQALNGAGSTGCTEKYSVFALGSRIMELMPVFETPAEKRVAERTAEITEQQKEKLEARLAVLSESLGGLSLVFEIASQPWPLPRAYPIEVEQEQNGAPLREISPIEGELSHADLLPVDPLPDNRGITEDVIGARREWRIDEPEASRLIALYFLDRVDEIVSARELAEFIYARCGDEVKDTANLRSRITTILGPQIQGLRMARLLGEEGYMLQYGWRKKIQKLSDGSTKQVGTRERVYRAVRAEEKQDVLDQFIDLEEVNGEHAAAENSSSSILRH